MTQLRDDRGYSYADIITVHPEKLPDYDNKVSFSAGIFCLVVHCSGMQHLTWSHIVSSSQVKAFFEEHIHDAEEIRYILSGSGFFDVRSKDDKWVRIHIKAGDLMTLPEGIYHRFTVDENDCIHAMRLFKGQPVWTPFNRPQEEHESRVKYVKEFLEEKKEDA